MPKRKKHSRAARPAQGRAPATDARQQGLRLFHAANYDGAIAAWSEPAEGDERVAKALAEAYARRSRTRTANSERITDLRRATELVPDDLRYTYGLGLALHAMGDLPAAIERYEAVLAQEPAFPGAALALAVALLEQDPGLDLATVPGSTQ